MNLKTSHNPEKQVSANALFEGKDGVVTSLQILQGAELSKHKSKIPALLLCITGEVVFENVKGFKETLHPGDYVDIEAEVEHWVKAVSDSYLLLMK